MTLSSGDGGEGGVLSISTWAVGSLGVGAVVGAVRGWQMRYRAALAIGVRSGLLDPVVASAGHGAITAHLWELVRAWPPSGAAMEA